MGLFTDWLKGPIDNSLEGRKKRLIDEGKEDFEALERQRQSVLAKQTAARGARQQAAAQQVADNILGVNLTPGGRRAKKQPTRADASPKQKARYDAELDAANTAAFEGPTETSTVSGGITKREFDARGGAEEPAAPAPAAVQMAARPPAPIDIDEDGIDDRVEQFIETFREKLSGAKHGAKLKVGAQKILDRLDHEKAGPRMKALLAAVLRQEARRNKSNTFSDEEGAIQFLTENMGLTRDDKGIFHEGLPNRELLSMAGASFPGEGRGEPRGVGYRELQALLDPARRQMLTEAAEDESGEGARTIHRNALKNDISWEMATRLYDMMDNGLQNKLNGWGKPDIAQGVFSPVGPIEFMKDADGNFTGETNVDVMRRTGDREGYDANFTNQAGGRNRGIFNLMKHLAQGGTDEFSGEQLPFPFDGVTPDHIGGRSSGNLPDGRHKDDPLNLAFIRRGLNQFKVSSGKKGSPLADTVPGMLKAAEKVKGVLGNVGRDEEDVQDLLESPNFINWLSYKFGQTEFDPKTIERRGGNRGYDRYPDTIEEFIDANYDDDILQSLVEKSSKTSNPLGLNMRNMSMRAPRVDDVPITENTWGGKPGGGTEYNPLSGYRRAMIASALFNPEYRQQLQEFEEGLSPKWSDEKKEEAVQKKRREIVAQNLFGPQKAIGTVYGMGAMTNDEFVDKLSELGGGRLEFLKESNPKAYETLMAGLKETLEGYRGDLAKQFPNNPFQVREEDLSKLLDSSYMRAIMSSNFGRSKFPNLIEAFDKIEKHAKIKDNLVEDGILKLNPDTVL